MKLIGPSMIAGALAAALFMGGCAKEPAKEIGEAKAALEAATAAEAQTYAPAQFAAASESLSMAMKVVERQNAKNPLARNYNAATKQLVSAKAAADEAATAAAQAKEQAQGEAGKLIEQVKQTVQDAENLIAKLPKAKAKKVGGPLTAQLNSVKADLQQAETLLTEAKPAEARDKANACVQSAGAVLEKAQKESASKKAAKKKRK